MIGFLESAKQEIAKRIPGLSTLGKKSPDKKYDEMQAQLRLDGYMPFAEKVRDELVKMTKGNDIKVDMEKVSGLYIQITIKHADGIGKGCEVNIYHHGRYSIGESDSVPGFYYHSSGELIGTLGKNDSADLHKILKVSREKLADMFLEPLPMKPLGKLESVFRKVFSHA
jgi:hypothetical protein